MRKILIIANPIAGPKLISLNQNLIKQVFPPTDDYDVKIVNTLHAGHGSELAKKEAQCNDYDTICIAGGDGSINEIASELVGSTINIGIIPTGSGNGLAHHLRIPKAFKHALEVIKHGIIQPIDVGVLENEGIGKKYFFSNCGFGYDAEVIHGYSNVGQRGFFTYVYFMFKSIFTLKPKRARIQFHEFDEVLKPFVFTVANSSQYGYKIEVAPDASISDGILDALLVRDASVFRVLKFSILSMLKMHDRVIDVADFYKTKQITIEFEEKTKLQFDGEPFFVEGKLDISIRNHALNVYIPSKL